jgi:hypothetical protein
MRGEPDFKGCQFRSKSLMKSIGTPRIPAEFGQYWIHMGYFATMLFCQRVQAKRVTGKSQYQTGWNV